MKANGNVLYVTLNNEESRVCTETEPCWRIQDAINIAVTGDIIEISQGRYYENIVFGSASSSSSVTNLTLIGAGELYTQIISENNSDDDDNDNDNDGGDENTEISSSSGTSSESNNNIFAEGGGSSGGGGFTSADTIADVWYANVHMEKIGFIHKEEISAEDAFAKPTKRAIGIHVRRTATHFSLFNCSIHRDIVYDSNQIVTSTNAGNDGSADDGSRALIVSDGANNIHINSNVFSGDYEDHIHASTSNSIFEYNSMTRARRIGMLILNENNNNNNNNGGNNTIKRNQVTDSVTNDGIQIQTSNNRLYNNFALGNYGAGIKLCGMDVNNDCLSPYDQWSQSNNNTLVGNRVDNNNGGDVVNNGKYNEISSIPFEDPEDIDNSFDDFDDDTVNPKPSTTNDLESSAKTKAAITTTTTGTAIFSMITLMITILFY